MRRSRELVSLTRREMCGGLAACIGAIVISGCSDSGGSNTPDASPPDAPAGPACGTSVTDVGAPATFMLNKPVYVQSKNVFVMRDAAGLFALTARCTHQGVTVTARTSNFYCSGHGATFTFDGDVISGPTSVPLQHFALCMLPNGNVGVDTAMPVAKTVRLSV